jgi:hypothetical protein
LLAWRSIKCGTEYGFTPDFGNYMSMNQLSEESNSVKDDNDDFNGDASITEVSEIDNFQENRRSENSNSLTDVNYNINGDASITVASEIYSLQNKRRCLRR